MTYYLVKKECEATVVCTIALGRTQTYYFGKPRLHLSRDFLPPEVTIRTAGYTDREEAAARLAEIQRSAVLEESSEYWKITASIIELEV